MEKQRFIQTAELMAELIETPRFNFKAFMEYVVRIAVRNKQTQKQQAMRQSLDQSDELYEQYRDIKLFN